MIDALAHEIGNPVFAIETNLVCLRNRIRQMESGLRNVSATEAYEICDAINIVIHW